MRSVEILPLDGFPFASNRPTQSPAVPGAFAIVAVATPPASRST